MTIKPEELSASCSKIYSVSVGSLGEDTSIEDTQHIEVIWELYKSSVNNAKTIHSKSVDKKNNKQILPGWRWTKNKFKKVHWMSTCWKVFVHAFIHEMNIGSDIFGQGYAPVLNLVGLIVLMPSRLPQHKQNTVLVSVWYHDFDFMSCIQHT